MENYYENEYPDRCVFTEQEVTKKFLKILDSMYYEKSSETFYQDPSVTLEQLGVDSLDTIEIDIVIGEEFGIYVGNTELGTLSSDMSISAAIKTIQDLLDKQSF